MFYGLHDIPNVSLLDANIASTAEMPRDGLTCVTDPNNSNKRYCLQQRGCKTEGNAVVEPRQYGVCSACRSALEDERVPSESLVMVDTGNAWCAC